MRPFLCSILKCDKCDTTEPFRITPTEITKESLPKCLPKAGEFKEKLAFLSDLIDSISRIGRGIIDIDEADLQLFLETEDFESAEHLKIIDLLYGIDVKTGVITCSNCNSVKNIRNGILIYNE